MIVYYLAISLIILLIMAFFLNSQEIVSPAVAYLAPFSLAAIDLIYNIKKWDVNLNWNTFYVIVGGSICLLISSGFVKIFSKYNRHAKDNFMEETKHEKEKLLKYIDVPKINLIFFAILQIITFFLCLISVVKIAQKYGITGNASEMIGGYKDLKSFTTEDVGLGKINNFLYDFCYASGYIWAYILINDYITTKKIKKMVILNFIISIAISLVKGSRGGAIALLCSTLALLIIFFSNNSKKKKISLKQIIVIIGITIIIVGTFQNVGALLGRKSSADFGGYLSVYLSAPIRNLNEYLKSNDYGSSNIFGKMTFIHIINYFGRKLEISNWIYEFDLPSLRANGYVTGNVYTTFYAYIYDFGYIGVPILMVIMGIISQLIYNKAIIGVNQKKRIDLWIVLYSYVFYMLTFSFFSNKFYESIFSIQFIKYIIFWILIRHYLEKIRFTYDNKKFY